jgi:hypothetical protein
MTEWGMLLLCAYIALGATGRLTRRQAGTAAVALTAVVIALVMVKYSHSTPTDKYIPQADSGVYLTGQTQQGVPSSTPTEDVTGAKPANWYTTTHASITSGNGDGGGN